MIRNKIFKDSLKTEFAFLRDELQEGFSNKVYIRRGRIMGMLDLLLFSDEISALEYCMYCSAYRTILFQ